MYKKRSILVALLLSFGACAAQTPDTDSPPEPMSSSRAAITQSLPVAPDPAQAERTRFRWEYISRAGIICGGGEKHSSIALKPTFACGAGFTPIIPFTFLEFGWAEHLNQHGLAGYMTFDANVPLASTKRPYQPQAIIGYTLMFKAADAVDYGLALEMPFPKRHKNLDSLRFEIRDNYTFLQPDEHRVMLRIGYMIGSTLFDE